MTPVITAAEWDARQKELQEQRAHWVSETIKAQCATMSVDDELAELRAYEAACTDATPLGWVNVYAYGHGNIIPTEERAKRVANADVIRTVRVYEHPAPAAMVRVTDDEIRAVLSDAQDKWTVLGNMEAYNDIALRGLRPLFDRAATASAGKLRDAVVKALDDYHKQRGTIPTLVDHVMFNLSPLIGRTTPPAVVVGACVMKDGKVTHLFSNATTRGQDSSEQLAQANNVDGGTAHRLYAGERITDTSALLTRTQEAR